MFLSNEGCRGFLRSTGRRYKESSTCYCAEGFPPRGRNSAAIVLLAEGACSTDSRAIPKCKPTEMPPSFGTCLCRMLLPRGQTHTCVCVHSASFALRAEGGKGNLARQVGRSSQLLAVPLRRASFTCLPGTMATASHNLQTATQNAPVCAPLPWDGSFYVVGGERVAARSPAGVRAPVTSADGDPPRAHTARGCPHPEHGSCTEKRTQLPRKPTEFC